MRQRPTISLAQPANPGIHPCLDRQQVSLAPPYAVDDANFKKLVAILRIAVPYTGMILRCVGRLPRSAHTPAQSTLLLSSPMVSPHPPTPPTPTRSTRESPEMRKTLLKVGMSQMSAGSKTDVGAYHRWVERRFLGEQGFCQELRLPG